MTMVGYENDIKEAQAYIQDLLKDQGLITIDYE